MIGKSDFEIDGIIPIIPTPFARDERIHTASLAGLVDFAVAAGACAVGLPAYGSEFYKLSEDERRQVIATAIEAAAGRIPVIAQVNHFSAAHAADAARWAQSSGASAICTAVPRLFALPENDIVRYFGRILGAIDIPLIIQDFNPGGPTISADFVADLHRIFPNFRYVKLEEPQMGAKVRAILRATDGEVGVVEGWGGMYLVELIHDGICGVMPSLALTDILVTIWQLVRRGEQAKAFAILQAVLPQIVFSLQHLELYHHAEKRLLSARGVLQETTVRDAAITLEPQQVDYIAFLNQNILSLLQQLGLRRNPVLTET